jgi:transposase
MTELEILLTNQNKALTDAIEKFEAKIDQLSKLVIEQNLIITKQQHRIEQLTRQLFGIKSEKLPVQPTLFEPLPFTQEELTPIAPEATTKTVASHQRKEIKKDPTSLRYELPEHLRREEVVIEPTEIPEGAERIGEEISEKLEFKKSELYVKRIIRPKYAKADKSGVVVADLPQGPIYRCMAGVSLLVQILIDKYLDHLPLNRQIERFARQGVKMKDSTLCDWVSAVAKLLEILYKEMTREVLCSNYIGADETTVKVLDPKIKGKCHQGYMWVYLGHDKNLVLFDYDPTRKKGVVGEKLKDFKGYLQSDGYAGYEQFSTNESIVRMACMAHARRKFDEALSNDRKRSLHALAMMQRLYRLEHLMRLFNIDNEGKKKLRQRIAVPLLNKMFDWMQDEFLKVTPTSTIGAAFNYALNRKEELIEYTKQGHLQIDNNLVENKIRPFAIGRKNYLFMGSHDSAQNTAMIYSFFQSCRLNNINPEEWLEDILMRINDTKQSELHTLLPNHWEKIDQKICRK